MNKEALKEVLIFWGSLILGFGLIILTIYLCAAKSPWFLLLLGIPVVTEISSCIYQSSIAEQTEKEQK